MTTAIQTKYQITGTHSSQYMVTGPENRGIEGDGYWLGVFRDERYARLFVEALELNDAGAPIGDGIFEDEEPDPLDELSDDALLDLYQNVSASQSWSDNSLAFNLGQNIADEGDFEFIGEQAISRLEDSGLI